MQVQSRLKCVAVFELLKVIKKSDRLLALGGTHLITTVQVSRGHPIRCHCPSRRLELYVDSLGL